MAETIAAGQIRALVERVERIESDVRELNADKSEIYKEAKSMGFDVATLKRVVQRRRKDPTEADEQDAIFDIYWSALTGRQGAEPRVRVHVHAHEEVPQAAAEPDPVPVFSANPKPLREHCLSPENCAGYGSRHCHRCLTAAAVSEKANPETIDG
ncbi:hypothetical protein CSC94_12635 [Zhengella mangrovi]|uniref:GapR-like DNA-binding domain-containing protein n=1 Tax=Zhengella mangrovi TaxID=1982044 RepID=A0A2G1QM08_9HYPH|nr:DUF2312 domain-containing protein [Zhengella mangrovi]PHP66532.1 hypothetical protein CSC94_12635 [Zhengella mangrovi]